MPTTVSVRVGRDAADVEAFIRDPASLPRWAAGLRDGVTVTFCPANPFGVVDHRVTDGAGLDITVPMRVVPDGDGSVVTLTVMSTADADGHDTDVAAVGRDLRTLAGLLAG